MLQVEPMFEPLEGFFDSPALVIELGEDASGKKLVTVRPAPSIPTPIAVG